jgi:branched-chain amino acid transport system substrate-binding protein
MMKKRNIWIVGIVVILIVIGIILMVNNQSKTKIETIRIGAVLPLTGTAAVYGEGLKNGMEIAKEELQKQGFNIEIMYEDSQGDAKQAVSAYENLKLKNIDIVITALSRSSIPLVPLAERDKIPLIMTVVSANLDSIRNNYTFRFYPDNLGYADAHFKTIKNYKKIAIMHVNDEFGNSLRDAIVKDADEKNMTIVIEESFNPGTTDFRTSLLKIKEKNPEALMIVGASPAEIINPLKNFRELNLNFDFYEVGTALSIKSERDKVNSEGVYTTAFPFVLGKTGQEFSKKYKNKYGEDAFFSAPFGYDIVMLVKQASEFDKTQLAKSIINLKGFNSLNEEVEIKDNGEINPVLYSVKIVNGSLVRVEDLK